MSELLNLPEALEAPRKLTRAESLAKARAARAAKKESGEVAPTKQPLSQADAEHEFWARAFLQVMNNFQVKSIPGLDACVPVADRALEIWKKKKEAK